MNKSIISFLALTIATPALSQQVAVDQNYDKLNDKEIVVTASRVTSEAREIGSALSILTQEDIAQNQTIFAKDIFQNLPGIQITTDRPGDITSVSIRGSDNDQVLYLIDGIELGDPSSISTQFSADNLTTADIARIEILRGNQSSLYGSDAIGGVINVITRRATEEGFTVNAEAEAGSYDTLNGGASIMGKTGPLDFRVTATGYRHKGPSLVDSVTATGPSSEKDEYWRYGFSGRAGLEVTDGLSVQAIGFLQNAFSDLDNNTSDSLSTTKNKEYAFAGQGNYVSSDEKFKADLTASRYVVRRLYFGAFNLPDGDFYRGEKNAASLKLAYDSQGIVSIAAGGEYEEEKTRQLTNFSGGLVAKITTKAAYGEVALRPIEGLTITGAARIDDNSRFGSFDTYRATAAYLIPNVGSGNVKLRASYGTGAKAPGLYQLFEPLYGNINLDVETSRGGDVGIDINLTGFSAQASYFFSKVENEIVFDGSVPPFGGYDQFGQSRNSGIELAFQLRPSNWLSFQQTYTYLDSERDRNETGNYTYSGRPKHTGSTSLVITPDDKLSLTARLRMRSRNESSFGGATKGYEVVDILGSYKITENVEAFGRVTNIFDAQYQLSFGKNTLGRAVYGGVRFGL